MITPKINHTNENQMKTIVQKLIQSSVIVSGATDTQPIASLFAGVGVDWAARPGNSLYVQ